MLNNFYQVAVALLPVYPFVWAFLVIFVRIYISKLPAAQQAALKAHALEVAQAVEQSANGLGSTDKKARALGLLEAVCKASGVKFDPALADVAIEATVFGFNQLKDVVEKTQPTVAPIQA